MKAKTKVVESQLDGAASVEGVKSLSQGSYVSPSSTQPTPHMKRMAGKGGKTHQVTPAPTNQSEEARRQEDERQRSLEEEETKGAYTLYSAAYNLLIKSLTSMEQRMEGLEKSPSWEGISVLEKALDSLAPALTEMHTLCMRYVNSIKDVGKMVEAAREGRSEVAQIQGGIQQLRNEELPWRGCGP